MHRVFPRLHRLTSREDAKSQGLVESIDARVSKNSASPISGDAIGRSNGITRSRPAPRAASPITRRPSEIRTAATAPGEIPLPGQLPPRAGASPLRAAGSIYIRASEKVCFSLERTEPPPTVFHPLPGAAAYLPRGKFDLSPFFTFVLNNSVGMLTRRRSPLLLVRRRV